MPILAHDSQTTTCGLVGLARFLHSILVRLGLTEFLVDKCIILREVFHSILAYIFISELKKNPISSLKNILYFKLQSGGLYVENCRGLNVSMKTYVLSHNLVCCKIRHHSTPHMPIYQLSLCDL